MVMGKYFLALLAALLLTTGVAFAQETKKAYLLDSFQGDIAAGKTIEVQASEKISWESYGAISFWLQGAGTGAKIAVDVEDDEGEFHRFMVTDDTRERKQAVCPFDAFFPRAYGQPIMTEPNGEIDFPIKSLRFELMTRATGPVLVDQVSLEALN